MDRGKGAQGKTKLGCGVGKCIGRSIGICEARREKGCRFSKKREGAPCGQMREE